VVAQQKCRENGQILAWAVILLPLFLALVGLVVDSGVLWVQFRRARWAADGAAVAAASEIDQVLFQRQGAVVVSQGGLSTARHYARLNHPGLYISQVYVHNNTICARGWVQIDTVFLGLFGVPSVRITVQGRERPAWGVAHPED
jgi:hypothetical protein